PEPDGPPAPAADLPEAPTGTEPSGDAGGAPSTADGPGATGLDLPPVAWVDVRTGAVVDLAADRGLGRDVAGRGEAPRLPAYSRGAVIGITTRKPIDVEATAEAGAADGGWVAVGGGLAPVDEPGKQDDLDEAGPADAEEPAGGVAVDDGADQAGGAPLFGRPGRKGRRAPRLALTLAPISAPPATGRLARRAEPPQDEAPVQDREAVVPFVPAQGRPPREVAEPPESPLTDVVPAARTPDEGRTPKQR
ncbi:hypothetical protein PQF33_28240, partial [Dactylosporangium aurantiacum]|nr:hypothetical protein [Dactylosporangium aurantiacum]